jgi:hypothetical protein
MWFIQASPATEDNAPPSRSRQHYRLKLGHYNTHSPRRRRTKRTVTSSLNPVKNIPESNRSKIRNGTYNIFGQKPVF